MQAQELKSVPHTSVASKASEPSTPKNTAIFIQNACLQHRYIRSKDLSNIVERPERLRAVHVGLAAAIARLEELYSQGSSLVKENQYYPPSNPVASSELRATPDTEDLVETMQKMKLDSGPSSSSASSFRCPVTIIQSQATLDILSHPAVKFIHGDIDGDVYLENLTKWVKESKEKIARGESEISEGYSQGDLYLCPESLKAIQGAAATVCEAVDKVIASTRVPAEQTSLIQRAFVAIRPPGHHCGEDTPSGFCFLNNVAIGAAHAHLQHGIKRIVILDIDLHHGNGTQSIIWQINEETYRRTLESEGGGPNQQRGPQIFYGSLHDILSYPCEDGKPALVQAASTSIHNAHGQWVENVHLQTYTSEEHFWDVLYKEKYSKLLEKAKDFIESTGGDGDDVLVFISCGMDANEHEYPSMSRHNRKVPVGFYHRFARDTSAFADRYARGRVVSVLEGGYSDRALMSGAMAHFCGLVDPPPDNEEKRGKDELDEVKEWWKLENLLKLEAATKKRRGGRPSASAQNQNLSEPWLERTLQIFSPLEAAAQQVLGSAPRSVVPIPTSDRTLRDRKGKVLVPTSPTSPTAKRASVSVGRGGAKAKPASASASHSPSARTKTKTTTTVIKIKPPSSASGSSTARAAAVSLIEREKEADWETAGGESPLTSPSPSSSSSSSEDEGEGYEEDDMHRHDARSLDIPSFATTTRTTSTTVAAKQSGNDLVGLQVADVEDDGIEISRSGFGVWLGSGTSAPPKVVPAGEEEEGDDLHRRDARLVAQDLVEAVDVGVEGSSVSSRSSVDVLGEVNEPPTKKVPTRRVILKLGKPPAEVE